MPDSVTDLEYKSLASTYGAGLSMSDMRKKLFGGTEPISMSNAEYAYYAGANTLSLSDKKYASRGGSGSMSDKDTTYWGVVTNLVQNPAPASVTNWSSNDAAKWVPGYAAGEITVDRQATATINIAASFYKVGAANSSPVLPVGVNYQRSFEVWVDAAATVTYAGLAGGFVGGQALPANQWTRVTEQFAGTGLAQNIMAFNIQIIGVSTGIHCKLRRSMLVANPTGKELAYSDGNSPGWKWDGTANTSTSSGPPIFVTPRTNLAVNPGYEVGTDCFVSNSAGIYVPSVETVSPISGTRSALFTRAASALDTNIANIQGRADSNRTPVTAGQPITGGMTVKSSVICHVYTRWYWYDASSVLTTGASTLRVSNLPVGQTVRVIETGTPPAGTVTANFLVIVGMPSGNVVGGEKVWADQLTLEYGATDGSYFDGGTPDTAGIDYAWTGTANASTSTATPK